ncbi:MAG: hypothetical protein ACFFBY_10505 [Promethearchaeota archaeon]
MIFNLKCPYTKPVVQWVLRFAMLAFGTIGIIFLNFWVAMVYLTFYIGFYFFAMPLKHCQYCYYRVKETTTDDETGMISTNLLPLDKWKEMYLKKHVTCAKKWSINFFITFFSPIILIIISFFLNFSLFALIFLIGFIAALSLMLIHMKRKVCPTCTIVEECHSAF